MIKTFAILLAFTTLLFAEEIKRENNVLVLTKDNFDAAVKDKTILVEFYAPWCGHCKILAPEYDKAAKQLEEENSDILLAKVDATAEKELSEDHDVKGYPTIKFFKDGKVIDYTGGRTSEEIIRWLKKKTSPPAIDLTSVEAAKKFVDSDVAVVAFFKDQESAEAKIYKEVAFELEDFVFGITSNSEVYSELKATKDGVVLFKKFDEGRNDFDGEFTVENIKDFVKINSLPLVVEFNHNTAQKIFGGSIKSHNLLFINKDHPQHDSLIDVFRNVAKEFKNKVLFVSINTDDADHERILDFFGLKKEQVPAMRIVKLGDHLLRYEPPTGGITETEIRDFVNGVLAGTIKQYLLSEDLPDDWDKYPVKVLVSKNFNEIVMDKSKNVLVEFYAPWCGHCKQLVPIYDSLGEKYKDRDDIVIAKMDAVANELEDVKIGSYPTIKLYKKDTNEVVDFNGERTLEGISRFIDSDGVDGAAVKEEEEDEEEEKDDEKAQRDEL